MDLVQFASNPSDPAWEGPRFDALHTIRPFSKDSSTRPNIEDLSERAKTLHDISMELQTLIAKKAPLSEVRNFTEKWKVSSPNNTPSIQPNLLAWFSDTNALRLAVGNDNPDIVRFLLQMGLSIPLMAVVFALSKLRETKNTTVLQLLLDFGWDINQPLGETGPPLISSVLETPDLVHWCLSKGADPSLSSPGGLSIIEHAASIAPLDVVKLLVGKIGAAREGAPVARASYSHAMSSKSDRVEVARFLLDQGYSVDAFYQSQKSSSGDACEEMVIGSQNALHFAIWGGKEDMVRLLLERGADRTLPARSVMKTEGKTLSPVELATKYGYTNLVALLQVPSKVENSWKHHDGQIELP